MTRGAPWRSARAISAVVAAACAVFASIVTIRLVIASQFAAAVAASAAILIVVMHGLAMFGMNEGGWIVFNLWLLALGILTLVEGVHMLELGTANRGLLALAALVIARFFDTDLSFLTRGLVFVAFGMACLAMNLWLMRRVRTTST
jgi:hypothetical protein